jgi:hypothetical protein
MRISSLMHHAPIIQLARVETQDHSEWHQKQKDTTEDPSYNSGFLCRSPEHRNCVKMRTSDDVGLPSRVGLNVTPLTPCKFRG